MPIQILFKLISEFDVISDSINFTEENLNRILYTFEATYMSHWFWLNRI